MGEADGLVQLRSGGGFSRLTLTQLLTVMTTRSLVIALGLGGTGQVNSLASQVLVDTEATFFKVPWQALNI